MADAPPVGVQVNFQLPTDGPLPKTYRVTLAAVDPKDPSWIVSTFASGVVCTVTAENQGKFTQTWDGLDDNYMPVPPGIYALKGIYMPAETWPIDGLYHTIVPKLTAMGSSWGQTPAQDVLPNKIEGDPVASPFRDVDVAPGGMGVTYFQYLENGTNAFLTDFNKPIGYDQIVTGYNSGSIGGGTSACTDGKQVWILCSVGHQFILHADGTPFGTGSAPGREKVYLPEGWVNGLAAWPDKELGQTVVFDTEGGKFVQNPAKKWRYTESSTDLIDEVRALDGGDAHILVRWKVERPKGLAARNGKLYILHGAGNGFEVLTLSLEPGWEKTQPSLLFKVPDGIQPFDMEADSHGRVYLSDSAANHVYQFDAQGNKLRTYGKLAAQKGGTYDPDSFMAPEKLGCWTDAAGQDRLLVVEQAGPNRMSEWSGDDGKMVRQWVIPQTKANEGYAVDPRHPDEIYIPGQEETLVRWKVDYTTGQWTTDAVWTGVGNSRDGNSQFGDKLVQGMCYPRIIYHGDDMYLAFWQGYTLYHLEGEHWRSCAALLRQKVDNQQKIYVWRDVNGDGQVQDDEYLPFEVTSPPPGLIRYFGDTWFDDLSLVCIGNGTPDVWRLTPTGFDKQGTPSYDPNGWKKLLTDKIYLDKKAGTATATRGGNETVGQGFDSAWASVAQAPGGDIYVDARTGPNFSANNGSQFKLSRYVSDGKGGYVQKWRVGRIAIQGNAKPGEVYGSVYVSPPINGLIGLIDSARAGVEIYTEDGLYVDTLFPDAHTMTHDQMGSYWQPGEYFSGYDYVDKDNGKIYLALGKVMPKIYEALGWSSTLNPVRPLTHLDKEVAISANQIAAPPEIALQVRGGAAAARVARFYPATGGGPALDGSMNGWEACDPIRFGTGDTQTVEARCFYDPDQIYLRWHVRLGHDFTAKPLDLPQHIFSHERGNDTLGFYLQGDPNATPGGAKPGGRAGDVRFVCGIFKDGETTKPVVVGMYPSWSGAQASPQTYTTPVGSVTFAHVGIVPDVKSGYQVDGDGKGFSLTVSIPRTAIPGAPKLDNWRTEGNFDANLGGIDRFWWSNADGSASRETFDEPTEARLYPGSWSAIQFLPIDSLPIHSWMVMGPFGFAGEDKLDIHKDRPLIIKTLTETAYPLETTRDFGATYQGDITQTKDEARLLAWKHVELAVDLVDPKEVLKWKGNEDPGTLFAVTHIYSPQAAKVTLQLSTPHGQGFVSGQLNNVALPQVKDRDRATIDEAQPLELKAGWNELILRDTTIWGDRHFGAKLVADPAVLWKLKISGPLPTAP